MNALHLSAALAAQANGVLAINIFLSEDAAASWFYGLAKEYEKIFCYWSDHIDETKHFTPHETKEFCESVCARILSHPQRVVDATTRFRRTTLIEFIKDFYRKIAHPYLMYTSTGAVLEYIPRVIAEVDELIATERFVE